MKKKTIFTLAVALLLLLGVSATLFVVLTDAPERGTIEPPLPSPGYTSTETPEPPEPPTTQSPPTTADQTPRPPEQPEHPRWLDAERWLEDDLWLNDDLWPTIESYRDHGGHSFNGEGDLGRFRPIFYILPYSFANLVDQNILLVWERSRSNEEYHNEAIAFAFVRDFNIAKEDFISANEERRQILMNMERTPEDSAWNELFPVDLIFSGDTEAINEFFLWENSIYAHEVGLELPPGMSCTLRLCYICGRE